MRIVNALRPQIPLFTTETLNSKSSPGLTLGGSLWEGFKVNASSRIGRYRYYHALCS